MVANGFVCSTICERRMPFADRVNNSTPRLLTTSRQLVDDHFPAVVRYLRTLIRAARWVESNRTEAVRLVARECSVGRDAMETCLEPDYADKFPALPDRRVEASACRHEDVPACAGVHRSGTSPWRDWIDSRPLAEAYRLEGLA